MDIPKLAIIEYHSSSPFLAKGSLKNYENFFLETIIDAETILFHATWEDNSREKTNDIHCYSL